MLFAHPRPSLVNAVLCAALNSALILVGLGSTGDYVGGASLAVLMLPVVALCSLFVGWVFGALSAQLLHKKERGDALIWIGRGVTLIISLCISWVTSILVGLVIVEVILPAFS